MAIGVNPDKFSTIIAWLKDGVEIDFSAVGNRIYIESGIRLSFSYTQPSDSGDYQAKMSNVAGITYSKNTTLAVLGKCRQNCSSRTLTLAEDVQFLSTYPSHYHDFQHILRNIFSRIW